MEAHYVIKRVLRTEKSVNDTGKNNKYHFEVAPQATKFQIREAFQHLFPDVHVTGVNTTWVLGKQRRYRFVQGTRTRWKKAVVTLRPGENINLGY